MFGPLGVAGWDEFSRLGPGPVAMTHPLIAREGWRHLGLVLLAAGLCTIWAPAWSLPLWLLVLFVLQFFRDPPRQTPTGEGLCISPADGRVISIEPADDPHLDRRTIRISIFMNVFNVHANRIPERATVLRREYRPGGYVNAALAKAAESNEANALVLQTEAGHRITLVQVAGLLARRIFCYVGEGDEVQRGQRYGFIRFGSRVDVYLPTSAEILVALGDPVCGGLDPLAQLLPASDVNS